LHQQLNASELSTQRLNEINNKTDSSNSTNSSSVGAAAAASSVKNQQYFLGFFSQIFFANTFLFILKGNC